MAHMSSLYTFDIRVCDNINCMIVLGATAVGQLSPIETQDRVPTPNTWRVNLMQLSQIILHIITLEPDWVPVPFLHRCTRNHV